MPDATPLPFLIPVPRSLTRETGAVAVPASPGVFVAGDAEGRLVKYLAGFMERLATREPRLPRLVLGGEAEAFVRIAFDGRAPEAFSLTVSPSGADIRAGDEAGAFYAFGALIQLLRQSPRELSCMTVEDAPAMGERGFMLDVSRTKVPTGEAIYGLIDRLAELRYNRLQLYVEHTYAFKDHETVWKDASPLMPKDIRKIDAYCRERFITLVPNLNGFGHFERWLKHAKYRHMAECPEGFWHDLARSHRDPGTLKPDQTSLDFMAALYDEYLPNFTSGEFNVGGDEPWELGQGWSKPLCEAKGKQTVYLEHMAGLHRLCAARGKRMQFWADILLEHPERAGEAPPDAVPVIWGYDAGHPFDAQCATLKKLGRRYLVAPGASTWNSFSTRWDNARTNIREALMYAKKHDAAGLLMTAWGDNGNHWAWPVMWPSLTLAGALAWNPEADPGEALESAVDLVWFRDGGVSAKLLMDYLATDALFKKSVRNKSVLWEILFNPPERLNEALAGVSVGELEKCRDHLKALTKRLRAADPKAERKFTKELLSGINLSLLATARGLWELAGRDDPMLRAFGFLVNEYREAWSLRARRGGLDESAAHLWRVEKEMRRAGRRLG